MTTKDRQPLVTFITFAVLVIMLVSCITGCSTTVPVTAKFPEPPKYTDKCPQLEKLKEDTKLDRKSTRLNSSHT